MKTTSFSSRCAIAASSLIVVLTAQPASADAKPAASQSEKSNPSPTGVDIKPETVAATFGSRTITIGEIDRELERPEMQSIIGRAKEQPEMMTRLRGAALSSIINRELLVAEARKSSAVSADDIQKEVDAFISAQGGKEKLSDALTAHGVTWEKFTQEIGDGIRLKKFVEIDVGRNIDVTDGEIKKTYDADPKSFATPEMVKARHILVLTPPGASAADVEKAQKRIREIREKVTAPDAKFEQIAQQTSEDEMTKQRGGDLGFFRRGMMVPEFEQAAFSLKAGEVSAPVKTQFGYHLIKVDEHKNPEVPTFEQAKENIRSVLLNDRRNKALTEKLIQLRQMANVRITMPELKLPEDPTAVN